MRPSLPSAAPVPRVLFLDHTASLGGAELYLLDAVQPFRATCCVALFGDGPLVARLADVGVATRILSAPPAMLAVTKQGGGMQRLQALPGLVRLVARVARLGRRYDVLFANSQKALVVAALAGRLARRPVLWNLHDLLTTEHFSAANRRLAVGLARWGVARVLANSEATRAAFGKAGGDLRRAHVVYNGHDARPFDRVPDDAVAALRRQLGLDGVPVVGVFSRLAHWKGQHVLIEALPRLPGVHALLIGDALFEPDRLYRAELQQQVDRLGLRRRVHFLGFRDDVPALMRAVDVVVHTSTAAEPFGRVLVEGMLARRPVVATRAGGALEVVTDETGVLVPPGDAAALADALQALLAHPGRAQRLGARGYERAVTHFSLPRLHAALRTHLQAVAAGDPSAFARPPLPHTHRAPSLSSAPSYSPAPLP